MSWSRHNRAPHFLIICGRQLEHEATIRYHDAPSRQAYSIYCSDMFWWTLEQSAVSIRRHAVNLTRTQSQTRTHLGRERERVRWRDGWMDAPTHTHTQIHYIDRPFYPYPSLSSCGLKNTKLSAESWAGASKSSLSSSLTRLAAQFVPMGWTAPWLPAELLRTPSLLPLPRCGLHKNFSYPGIRSPEFGAQEYSVAKQGIQTDSNQSYSIRIMIVIVKLGLLRLVPRSDIEVYWARNGHEESHSPCRWLKQCQVEILGYCKSTQGFWLLPDPENPWGACGCSMPWCCSSCQNHQQLQLLCLGFPDSGFLQPKRRRLDFLECRHFALEHGSMCETV